MTSMWCHDVAAVTRGFCTLAALLMCGWSEAAEPPGAPPLPEVLTNRLAFSASTEAIAPEKHLLEAEAAELAGGAPKVADDAASGGYLVGLTKPGQGLKFAGLPAAGTLAIRYASVEAGTISVAVNDQPPRKVNIHSSGDLTGSFLHVIIGVAIPANARLTLSRAADDVAVNIDRVTSNGDCFVPSRFTG